MSDTTAPKNITKVHCQSCGSTRTEDVGYDALRRGEGYTACCNERAIYPSTDAYGRATTCATINNCYHD